MLIILIRIVAHACLGAVFGFMIGAAVDDLMRGWKELTKDEDQ